MTMWQGRQPRVWVPSNRLVRLIAGLGVVIGLTRCILPEVSASAAEAGTSQASQHEALPQDASGQATTDTNQTTKVDDALAADAGATLATESAKNGAEGPAAMSSTSAGTGGASGAAAPGEAGAPASGVPADGALGSPCAVANDCRGHACTDGVCCAAKVCPTCQSCGVAGVCEQITDLSSELAVNRCSGLGGSCSESTACITGICVDGSCCTERSCDICHSCGVDGARGNCAAVSDDIDKRGCTGGRMCHAGQCAVIAAEELRNTVRTSFGNRPDRLAQTVRVTAAGQLVAVRLAFDCALSVGFQVAIHGVDGDGSPAQTQLAQTEHGPFKVAPALRYFPLLSPLPVRAGQNLALVVSLDDPSSYCQLWGPGTNTYPGGDGFEWSSQENAWTALSADFAMQVLVQP